MKRKTYFVILVGSMMFLSGVMIVGSIRNNTIETTIINEQLGNVELNEQANIFEIVKQPENAEEIKIPNPPDQSTIHADAGKPYSGDVNENIKFDGSGTYVNPSTGAIYEWNFGDGTTGFGKYTYHKYSEAGVYYPSLKVTTINDDEYLDDTVVYIGQDGAHLEPYGGCHYFAEVDEKITFDASKSISNDPDSPISKYIWYFGDGEKAYGKKVTHSYDKSRVYLVTLVTKDINGNTRHDLLHADIGNSYTSIYDCFLNIGNTLEEIFDILLDKLNSGMNFLLKYFNGKIYTNYNGQEIYTDISSLPIKFDVNNNGIDDIWIDQLSFFEVKKGSSLFADGDSFVWYQFETTLSGVRKINDGDIKAEDDFTFCLQVEFPGQLLTYLNLDAPLIRIGFNSPPGEEMPESVTFKHIFKPNIIPGLFFNNNAKSLQQSHTTNLKQSTNGQSSFIMDAKETKVIPVTTHISKNTIIKNSGKNENQQSIVSSEELNLMGKKIDAKKLINPPSTLDLETGYYPEYALQLTSSGGGKFSLVRMFLKSESEDDTGIILKAAVDHQGGDTSNVVFKMMKESEIFHRGLKVEVPDNKVTVSILRIQDGDVKTELTTDLFWNQEKIRKVFWDDNGGYLRFETKTSAGLQNLYFYNQNPELTITAEEILFKVSGSFELSFIEGLDLTGSAGFTLSDLSFSTSNFNGGIVGTLELSISKSITFGFYKEDTEIGLKLGSSGELHLISDCIYELNEYDATLLGSFTFGTGDSEIRIALDNEKLILGLENGQSTDIQNLYFNVGDITLTADKLNIGSVGRIEIDWAYQDHITISLESGIDIFFENVNLFLTDILAFNVDGSLIMESNGYITFSIDQIEIGLSNSLELSDNFNFNFNGISVEITGVFDISSTGTFTITWTHSQILCSISDHQQLLINDFHFKIYPLTVDFSSANFMIGGDITILLDKENKKFEIGGSLSFEMGGFSIAYEQDTLCSIGKFTVFGGGNFKVLADTYTIITIDFKGGISFLNLQIEPSIQWNWLLQKFSIGSISYAGDVQVNLEKTLNAGKFEFIGNPQDVEVTDFYLNLFNNAFKIDLGELSFSDQFYIKLEKVGNSNSAEISSYGSFSLVDLDSDMGNIDFDISSIDADFSDSLLINLGDSIIPSIELIGGVQFNVIELDLTIGIWYLKIPEVDIEGNGDFKISWDNEDLTMNIDQNIQWDLEVDTTNLGDWETIGNFDGEVDVTAHKSGDSGYVQLDILDSGVQYDLKIIHGPITFSLGTFNLDPGTIKFEWQKELSATEPGYFNIINSNVEGDLTAFYITYDDGSNPVITMELLNIDFDSGNTYFTWSIIHDDYIEMDRYSTLDCDAFKFKWGSKIISLDVFTLQTGK